VPRQDLDLIADLELAAGILQPERSVLVAGDSVRRTRQIHRLRGRFIG
jgi:hypothetical protein